MIFSDRDLHDLIKSGRLAIDPFDPAAVQPSSIDLRIGRQFRVFANSRYPYIDVRQPMEDLTELVEASEEEPFILHPGEFVLAVTLERVTLPDDVVGRLEGKSSLGRLGLLIHSSLPGSEPVLIRQADGSVAWIPIEDIVRKQIEGEVAAFDPDSFKVQYTPITGWYEGPPDRIFEVILASGRSVRVTAGHNLFTLDRDGHLTKVRTAELATGARVAIPHRLPEPAAGEVEVDLLELAPEQDLATVASGDMELPSGRRALRQSTWRDLGEADAGLPVDDELFHRLDRLTTGDLLWDDVVEVRDTGEFETIYDLEVRPDGRKIENFLAGSGGVFVSNTAGFVDAGFDGYLTLELSNVANLPITIYPGMKIGQISLFQMTSPAMHPYGSTELGSKYLGQEGPTPSQYYKNFEDD